MINECERKNTLIASEISFKFIILVKINVITITDYRLQNIEKKTHYFSVFQ